MVIIILGFPHSKTVEIKSSKIALNHYQINRAWKKEDTQKQYLLFNDEFEQNFKFFYKNCKKMICM